MRFTVFHHKVECISTGCYITSVSPANGIQEEFVPRSQLFAPLIVAVIVALVMWRAVRRRRKKPAR